VQGGQEFIFMVIALLSCPALHQCNNENYFHVR
jgi:hypothetical protein